MHTNACWMQVCVGQCNTGKLSWHSFQCEEFFFLRLCNSYRILIIAQNLSAVFICPRTELCSLALKLSSLKQTFVPIVSVFITLATGEKVIYRTLALQLHVCEPCRLVFEAIQSVASVMAGGTQLKMQGWWKSHLFQLQIVHAQFWAGGLLSSFRLPVVSMLHLMYTDVR